MNRIKQLRKEKGLNQRELSILLNINVPTVSKYESDDVDISASKLKVLSDIFNTSIDYILCNDKNFSYNKKNNTDYKLTNEEQIILHKLRALPENRRIKIEARIEAEYDIVMENEQELRQKA